MKVKWYSKEELKAIPLLKEKTVRLVLININKTYKTSPNYYSSVTHSWSVDPRFANQADYILCELQGVVREVFRMDAKKFQPDAKHVGPRKRYFFNGSVVDSSDIRSRYIGHRIIKKRGESNPIHYINIT